MSLLIGKQFLAPRRLCNDFIVTIVKNGFKKLHQGIWNKKTVLAYLGMYGINNEYTSTLIENVENGCNVLKIPSN